MVQGMAGAARSWSRAGLVLTLYLALASAGVAWSSLRGDSSTWRLAGRENTQILLGIVAGVLIGLGYVFASRLAVHRFEWARALHRDMRAMLGPLPDAEVVVLAVVVLLNIMLEEVAVASAVGEEIFFRGALLPAIGLWGSSLVFALLHVGPKLRFLPWTISSFIAGLVFGQLFLWSGDLTGPVVAHFTVNFLNLRYLSAHEMR